MATITNFAYKGRGKIWVGAAATDTDMRSLGNVSAAELSFTTEEQTLKDFRTCAGGNYASSLSVDEANFSLTLHDMSPENVAMAFYGTTGTVAEAAATEEVHTVPTTTNRLVETDAVIKIESPSTVEVSSATGGGGTVYVEGTDYNVHVGGIEYILGGSLSGSETVYVNFTRRAVTTIEALMASSVERYMRVDGLNCAQSGAPVVIQMWRAKPAPAEAFQLIQEEFASFTLSGKMDADTSKGSSESQYFKVHVATDT